MLLNELENEPNFDDEIVKEVRFLDEKSKKLKKKSEQKKLDFAKSISEWYSKNRNDVCILYIFFILNNIEIIWLPNSPMLAKELLLKNLDLILKVKASYLINIKKCIIYLTRT